MCLRTTMTDLGPADACLDLAASELVFTTGLTSVQRVALARRLLAGHGQEQPGLGVTCLCGNSLDVTDLQDNRRTA